MVGIASITTLIARKLEPQSTDNVARTNKIFTFSNTIYLINLIKKVILNPLF